MARALRVEYSGARYHIMCRGNQGKSIFITDEDATLFIKTLGEVCIRDDVIIHAWCLMSNHYHILLETPSGNLVDTMKWLQGTFTQRYNARHQLWGHLFQGRYKAKIIDDTEPEYFRRVSEYIHLNPAAAKLVPSGKLAKYPWSSYRYYLAVPSKRPKWLDVQSVFSASGISGDTAVSRRKYSLYMDIKHRELLEEDADTLLDESREMERGWVHGDKMFKKCLQADLRKRSIDMSCLLDKSQKEDMAGVAAEAVILKCLKYFGIKQNELGRLPKSDDRKQLIAGLIRYNYPVKAQWVSEQLYMGHFTTVSKAMRFYDAAEGKNLKQKQRILKFID